MNSEHGSTVHADADTHTEWPPELTYIDNRVSWELSNWCMNFGHPKSFCLLICRFIISFLQKQEQTCIIRQNINVIRTTWKIVSLWSWKLEDQQGKIFMEVFGSFYWLFFFKLPKDDLNVRESWTVSLIKQISPVGPLIVRLDWTHIMILHKKREISLVWPSSIHRLHNSQLTLMDKEKKKTAPCVKSWDIFPFKFLVVKWVLTNPGRSKINVSTETDTGRNI